MTGSLQIKDNKYYIVLNSYASGRNGSERPCR